MKRYLVFALLYLMYVLLVPLIQSPYTPATAYMGVGACYGVSRNSSSLFGSTLTDSSGWKFSSSSSGDHEGGVLFKAVARLVGGMAGSVKTYVCGELDALCGLNVWFAADCDMLFLHSPADSATVSRSSV